MCSPASSLISRSLKRVNLTLSDVIVCRRVLTVRLVYVVYCSIVHCGDCVDICESPQPYVCTRCTCCYNLERIILTFSMRVAPPRPSYVSMAKANARELARPYPSAIGCKPGVRPPQPMREERKAPNSWSYTILRREPRDSHSESVTGVKTSPHAIRAEARTV